MKWKTSKILKALTLSVLALPASLNAIESTWLFDGSLAVLAGQDPTGDESTRTGGTKSSFFVMPIIGWRGSRFFLSPSLDVSYSGVNTPLEVDDDLFLFSQQVDSLLEIGGTFKSSPKSRWTLKGFTENFSGRLTKDEEWGNGLYDYVDAGAYFDWGRTWGSRFVMKTTIGLKHTDRLYINYPSLDGSDINEKDSIIDKLYFDYEIRWPVKNAVFTTEFSFSSHEMKYKELRIQDESGLLTDENGSPNPLRLDKVQVFGLRAPIEMGRHSLFISFDSEYRDSNLTLFDSQSFEFIPDFNDYLETGITLGYGYQIPKFWFFKAPYIGLQFTNLNRAYSARPAQDKTGAYMDGVAQKDGQIQFNLDLNSPISEHWAFFWNSNSVTYSSNNENEGSSLYNYRFVTTSMGFQFSY